MRVFLIFVLLLVTVLVKSKKLKLTPPKQLTEYDQCKIQCKTQRDVLSKQEYVEQLKKELEIAETLLENQKDNLPENTGNSTENGAQKASRYDHLKAAASKIVESGSELKQAVTGGNSN